MIAQAKMTRSPKGLRVPAKKDVDESTYSGRIAARLRKLRTDKGWTVKDLRERLNRTLPASMRLKPSTLHGWDAGDRKVDPDYYPALAAVFGLSVRAFLPTE
jgi:transcriptional regulator with XRE-family HTH domain